MRQTGRERAADGPVRVLVGARAAIVSGGLRSGLGGPGFAVIGEVHTAEELVRSVEALSPDVVVLAASHEDLARPKALPAIEAASRRAPVVLVSLSAEMGSAMLMALLRGVSSWLGKSLSADDLKLAVRAAARGLSVVDAGALRSGVEHFIRVHGAEQGARSAGACDALSARERHVLRLMAQGMSNAQIARSLGVTQGTVRAHASSVFGKLHVTGRLDAVLWAVRQGLAPAESRSAAPSPGPHPPRPPAA